MISKCFHIRLAARCSIALRVRWTHIRGIFSDDIGKRSLVLDHLLLPHVRGDVLKTVMGPGMRSNLVSFSDHTPDNGRVRSCCINGTFAKIVAGDEECRTEAKALQSIQQFTCIKVWPIVIGQRDDIVFQAIIDIVVVGYFSQQWSRIVQSGSSGRRCVRVTNAILILAAGVLTVIFCGATIARSGTALSSGAFGIAESRPAGTVTAASGSGSGAITKGRLTSVRAVFSGIPTVSLSISSASLGRRGQIHTQQTNSKVRPDRHCFRS